MHSHDSTFMLEGAGLVSVKVLMGQAFSMTGSSACAVVHPKIAGTGVEYDVECLSGISDGDRPEILRLPNKSFKKKKYKTDKTGPLI